MPAIGKKKVNLPLADVSGPSEPCHLVFTPLGMGKGPAAASFLVSGRPYCQVYGVRSTDLLCYFY